jgi:hypothetical protein
MARVEITFFTAGNRSIEGGSMPVPRLDGMVTEVLNSTTTSAATTTASTGRGPSTGFVRINAAADVWVVAGAAPVAVVPSTGTTQPGLRIPANTLTDLAVLEGDRIALIEVA